MLYSAPDDVHVRHAKAVLAKAGQACRYLCARTITSAIHRAIMLPTRFITASAFLFMPAIPVGILGATGMVGQQFIALLARHPWFRVAWIGASQRSEGKSYRDAAAWRLAAPVDDHVSKMQVDAAVPDRAPRLVFSGLDSSVAGEI